MVETLVEVGVWWKVGGVDNIDGGNIGAQWKVGAWWKDQQM